ncbi:hypothetical protein INF37_02365 [Pseudoflavonifractor sp. DSM 107456]|uniref:Uncharacterized protein n=2 Tax=Pseudoflavonifractor TaxID=1017280 RepID=A0ABR9R8Y6_9FIRM|nr:MULTISPECIES: hypothetical protein [Pseudoflavonifractor]MBC5729671.1 hypothetical protein [Pseudoflavonifractor hominis]MBE5054850.1 hypothetical protein [Pseudoflavonifractor gallinarum]
MTKNRALNQGLQLLLAAEGLQLLLGLANLVGLSQLFFSGFLSLGCMAMTLAGLYTLRSVDGSYQLAFHFSIANVVVVFAGSIAASILGVMITLEILPVLVLLLSCIAQILVCLVVRFCCRATCGQLMERRADGLAAQGEQAALLYIIVTAVAVFSYVLSLLPTPAGVMRFVTILANVLLLTAMGMYVKFLFLSMKTLAVE